MEQASNNLKKPQEHGDGAENNMSDGQHKNEDDGSVPRPEARAVGLVPERPRHVKRRAGMGPELFFLGLKLEENKGLRPIWYGGS